MSRYGVSIKIDVSKIDKSKLFRGEKGVYLDATMWLHTGEPDQYGHHGMVTQSTTKEEREQGINGAILGNVRIFHTQESQPAQQNYPQENSYQQSDNQQPIQNDAEDDIPF